MLTREDKSLYYYITTSHSYHYKSMMGMYYVCIMSCSKFSIIIILKYNRLGNNNKKLKIKK